MVSVNNISREIARQLSLYTDEVEEEVEKAKDELSKEAVALLKEKSPQKTGKYAKGWARKKVGNDYVIYNRKKSQITHLLENGHVKSTGGRVPARVHIRPVEENISNKYLERVERVVRP